MCEYVVMVNDLIALDTLNFKKALDTYKEAIKEKAKYTALYQKVGDKLVALKHKWRRK